MAAATAKTQIFFGSDERIALARAVAGLIGRIARLSVVSRTTGYVPAVDHLCMAEPGSYDMTATGVIIEIHDSCFAPETRGWLQVRELATPFGRWRVCPGVHNGGGDVFMPANDLNRLLEECDATDLPRMDALALFGSRSEFTRRQVLRRIGELRLPHAIGVRNEYDIPGYDFSDCTARKLEWEKQIAPHLAEWYGVA